MSSSVYHFTLLWNGVDVKVKNTTSQMKNVDQNVNTIDTIRNIFN